MNTPIIISNTKSYIVNLKDFYKLQNDIWKNLKKENYKYHVAVPSSLITLISRESYKAFTVGAQNYGALENGAHTGCDTVENIKESGAKFVILGHSEVRAGGDTSESISEKVNLALNSNIYAVLCVGEKSRTVQDEKYEDGYIDELIKMLTSSLKGINKNKTDKLIIAYEPVWAIGSNLPASPDVVMQTVVLIRRELAKVFGIEAAKKIKIIYGGSVDEDNAKDYIRNATCDGVLVGRASMNAKVFANIVNNIYA
jgi:triosephosphate isomerase